jgi:hypothetical protein
LVNIVLVAVTVPSSISRLITMEVDVMIRVSWMVDTVVVTEILSVMNCVVVTGTVTVLVTGKPVDVVVKGWLRLPQSRQGNHYAGKFNAAIAAKVESTNKACYAANCVNIV